LSRDDHRDAVLRWPKSGSDWPTNTTRPRRRSHNQPAPQPAMQQQQEIQPDDEKKE